MAKKPGKITKLPYKRSRRVAKNKAFDKKLSNRSIRRQAKQDPEGAPTKKSYYGW